MKTKNLNQNLFNKFKIEKSKMETLKGGLLQGHGVIIDSAYSGCGYDATMGYYVNETCGVYEDGYSTSTFTRTARCA